MAVCFVFAERDQKRYNEKMSSLLSSSPGPSVPADTAPYVTLMPSISSIASYSPKSLLQDDQVSTSLNITNRAYCSKLSWRGSAELYRLLASVSVLQAMRPTASRSATTRSCCTTPPTGTSS